MNLLDFLIKYKWIALGISLGAVAGYAYYYFIGCASGTCMITSKPLNSTAYGALMGGLLANLFVSQKPTNNKA